MYMSMSITYAEFQISLLWSSWLDCVERVWFERKLVFSLPMAEGVDQLTWSCANRLFRLLWMWQSFVLLQSLMLAMIWGIFIVSLFSLVLVVTHCVVLWHGSSSADVNVTNVQQQTSEFYLIKIFVVLVGIPSQLQKWLQCNLRWICARLYFINI